MHTPIVKLDIRSFTPMNFNLKPGSHTIELVSYDAKNNRKGPKSKPFLSVSGVG